MAKARRQLQDQLARTDVVIEVCDARLPASSRNPDLDDLIRHKPRILLVNKADLADPGFTRAWTAHFQAQGITAIAINSLRMSAKVLPLIERAASARVESAQQRGFRRTVRAMVVGVPNVGKSTLINLLKGRATIKTEDRPGVTRSTQWFRVTPYLELMDSPGMLWPKLEDPLAARRLAFIGSIRDQVHDTAQLAEQLLSELMDNHAPLVMQRYKLDDPTLRGQALLEAICKSRGFLLRGGVLDMDRAVAAVLDEFRDGRIGRITLESPPAKQQ
ncbi:MAG: ribosome biogenesis GTPase YlqF [Clostridiales bacterium]|nr:ribosome biogenesis GTPase YlqF [Clostridiales bacterium]